MTLEQIGKTVSLCPVCLKRIPAVRLRSGNDIYLQKRCPEHGDFQTVIWRGKPDFRSWYRVKEAEPPRTTLTRVENGCPFDCGPCPEHRRQSCCVLVEVTQRCNLKCPLCFADSGKGNSKDPTFAYIREQLQFLWQTTGSCNIQISGGEPTVREDLPAIIEAARAIGFTFIQLNTNGIRLAEDAGYVKNLRESGLDTVFLQYDGTEDEIYRSLRGRPLLRVKQKAIENCALHRLGVVLVPTLVPGVNTANIGSIIDYALKGLPAIRAVHFQPVSYFGRYPVPPADKDRITLPEVMRAIESQTGGLCKVYHFAPAGCEHNLCAFHGDFLVEDDGTLTPLTRSEIDCCSGRDRPEIVTVLQKRSFVRKRWALREDAASCCDKNRPAGQSIDQLLNRLQNRRLSISCMAFQDVENLDLERLRDCCLNVLSNGKIIPFCAYNLSSRQGVFLYRERSR
jgi:uncharacterized radical SAM superfamily Fe-S cluster-containing enzyme